MNFWLVAEITLLLAAIPCAYLLLRAPSLDRGLLVVQIGVFMAVITLLVLAQAMAQPALYDLAIVSLGLSFGVGLVMACFLKRLVG